MNIYHFFLKSLRSFVLKLCGDNNWHYAPSECNTNAQETSDIIYKLLTNSDPVMVARYGSTELYCIANYRSISSKKHSIVKYVKGDTEQWWWNPSFMHQMMEWSGFFPPTEEKLAEFCELMIRDSRELDVLGGWLRRESCMNDLLSGAFITHLMYLEPFWCEKPWTRALEGKRVVVVHPFAPVIDSQYKKREHLFKNKEILPQFHLRTVASVQSLGGEDNGFGDWFEALTWMVNEIEKEPYDICLLGCGAYGFPLAAHCKRSGHKAVHLGGSLQLLFGIIGNRWADPNYGVDVWHIPNGSYSSLINSHWVRPGDIGKPLNAKNIEGGCYW